MRIRKKDWVRSELEASSFVITDPIKFKGKWINEFNNTNPIHLELGCGTGKFICENALNNPNLNYIGIDMKDEVLIYAKRNVDKLISSDNYVNNIRLIPMQIAYVDDIFDKDEISRIYINFCNPWPKARQNKRRLTFPSFLQKYKMFLKPSSQIWFKTDDKNLFEDSINYFSENGFKINFITYDLHKSDFKNNIMTEYEIRFSLIKTPIMFLIAQLD